MRGDFFLESGGIIDRLKIPQLGFQTEPYFLRTRFSGYFLSYRFIEFHAQNIDSYSLFFDEDGNGSMNYLSLNTKGISIVRGNQSFSIGVGIKKYEGNYYTKMFSQEEEIRSYEELSDFLEYSFEKIEPVEIEFYYITAGISFMAHPNLRVNFLMSPVKNIEIEDLGVEIKPYYESGINFFMGKNISFNLSLGLNMRKVFPFVSEIEEQPIKISTLVYMGNFYFITGFKGNLKDPNGFLNSESSSYFTAGFGFYSKNNLFILVSSSMLSSGDISSFSFTVGYFFGAR